MKINQARRWDEMYKRCFFFELFIWHISCYSQPSHPSSHATFSCTLENSSRTASIHVPTLPPIVNLCRFVPLIRSDCDCIVSSISGLTLALYRELERGRERERDYHERATLPVTDDEVRTNHFLSTRRPLFRSFLSFPFLWSCLNFAV